MNVNNQVLQNISFSLLFFALYVFMILVQIRIALHKVACQPMIPSFLSLSSSGIIHPSNRQYCSSLQKAEASAAFSFHCWHRFLSRDWCCSFWLPMLITLPHPNVQHHFSLTFDTRSFRRPMQLLSGSRSGAWLLFPWLAQLLSLSLFSWQCLSFIPFIENIFSDEIWMAISN